MAIFNQKMRQIVRGFSLPPGCGIACYYAKAKNQPRKDPLESPFFWEEFKPYCIYTLRSIHLFCGHIAKPGAMANLCFCFFLPAKENSYSSSVEVLNICILEPGAGLIDILF